jgi:hypothetical protein
MSEGEGRIQNDDFHTRKKARASNHQGLFTPRLANYICLTWNILTRLRIHADSEQIELLKLFDFESIT